MLAESPLKVGQYKRKSCLASNQGSPSKRRKQTEAEELEAFFDREDKIEIEAITDEEFQPVDDGTSSGSGTTSSDKESKAEEEVATEKDDTEDEDANDLQIDMNVNLASSSPPDRKTVGARSKKKLRKEFEKSLRARKPINYFAERTSPSDDEQPRVSSARKINRSFNIRTFATPQRRRKLVRGSSPLSTSPRNQSHGRLIPEDDDETPTVALKLKEEKLKRERAEEEAKIWHSERAIMIDD